MAQAITLDEWHQLWKRVEELATGITEIKSLLLEARPAEPEMSLAEEFAREFPGLKLHEDLVGLGNSELPLPVQQEKEALAHALESIYTAVEDIG